MSTENLKQFMKHNYISQKQLSETIGVSRFYINKILNGSRPMTEGLEYKINEFYPDAFKDMTTQLNSSTTSADIVPIKFRPDVKLSAGYGSVVITEDCETIMIDRKILITNKGLQINPKYCEVVTVSGDSMMPEYKDGDRVIIDKSITNFIDGHIFAFRLDDQCYIKRVNVLPNKIKCIPLNEKYDTFYINESDSYSVLGLILPRIRF